MSTQGPTRVLYLLTDEISSVLVRGQLGHLVDEGFAVTVATRLDRGDTPAAGEPSTSTPPVWDDGVDVEHVAFVREPSPLADLRALWATVALIRRVRPSIVNASTPKAGLLGMVAAWLCRVPVRVYVVRGFRFETATGWRRRVFHRLEWVAMRAAGHVVFNSRSLLELAEQERLLPEGRGEVIGGGSGNGIDVDRFADVRDLDPATARGQLGLPTDASVVGFVGRFTSDKGIADLIDAYCSLRPTRPELRLLLVGQFEDGDPVPDGVRDTIDSDDGVVTVRWLSNPGAAYRAMDVLAFPSYREGLPNVPLEAQLCAVPVVGYAATGTVDAVFVAAPGADDAAVDEGVTGVGGGVLVPVGDVDGLATEIGTLLDRPDRRAAMGAAGAAWVVDRFDRQVLWDGLVRRYRSWAAG